MVGCEKGGGILDERRKYRGKKRARRSDITYKCKF